MSYYNNDINVRLRAGDGTEITETLGALDVNSTNESIVVDDSAFTMGTDSVAMMGATFDDTTPDSIDEGDAGAIRMSANRNLYVNIRDNAGNERGLNIDANGQLGVTQFSHDSLNCNANLQVGNLDLSYGQTTMSASIPCNLASDQSYPEVNETTPNMWNNASTGIAGNSSSVDTRYASNCTIFGTVSGSTLLEVYFSSDDSTFYKSSHSYSSLGAEDVEITFKCASRYVRVQSSADVTTTLLLSAKQ